jgi:SNF2 family DNA or RNA helicase
MKDAGAVNTEDVGALRCPNCRGPVNATRITDYKAFKQVHQPELLTEAEKSALDPEAVQEDGDSDTDSDSDTVDESETEVEAENDDEDATLGGFIVPDAAEDDDDDDETEAELPSLDKPKKKNNASMKSFIQKKKSKGKQPAKKAKEPKGSSKMKSLAQLKKEGMRNRASRRRYFKRLEKWYKPSAKIDRTIALLNEISVEHPGEKTLVFSQFTSFLDILEIGLTKANFKCLRYDGSMSTDQRSASVEQFRRDSSIPVLLLSLKAGNAGLNLNFASQVLILDPFWNPFVEEQAMDRAHRIGQRHDVHVRRVVVPGTVEDRILELQEKKRTQINAALDENAGKNIGRLGVRELAFLFGLDERGRALPAVQRDMITAGPSGV